METPDFKHGRVYFKQFGAERVKLNKVKKNYGVVFSFLGETWMPVDFTSDGSAVMALADVVSSGCSFNMKFWPFDKQTCDISFAVYGYTINKVKLKTISENSLTSIIINENIEWDVTGGTLFVRDDRGLSEIILRLEIERKSGIFIILILFPLYGLAFLSSFVFLLPSDAGERIGFTTTLMLSMTVFLDVISDYIPNASEPIPLLCIVVAMGLSMSMTCTITTIISLHFYHKDTDTPINGFFIKFVKLFDTKLRKHKVDNVSEAIPEDKLEEYESSIDKKGSLQSSMEAIRNTKDILNNKWTTTEELKVSWKDVSYTIDKMCFMGGTAIHVIVTVCFTTYMVLGTN